MSELERLYAAERLRLTREPPAGNKYTGEYSRPVFGCGREDAELMFIGEAPGAAETEAGIPFVGKAGRQLDELLSLAGIPREEIFVTNAVKYRPTRIGSRSVSNRTPSRGEILYGMPLLVREIAAVRPRFIMTLGNTPLFSAAEAAGLHKLTIGELHGRAVSASVEDCDFTLFPLYHPASGIYNRELIAVMREDILALGRIAGYAAGGANT